MGLFSSKEDKELISRISMQIEQQQRTIEALNNNIASMQSAIKSAENNKNETLEIERLNSLLKSKQEEISRLNDVIRKQNEDINKLTESNKKLNEIQKNIPASNEFVLCAGKYKGGADIPVGVYNLSIISGTGIVETKKPYNIFERLESNPAVRKERNWSNLYNGLHISEETVLDISESAKIKFVFAREIQKDAKLDTNISITDKFILGAGKYKGGIDIPIGCYDLKVISGEGYFEVNKPENVCENITHEKNNDFGFINEYKNLEISDKSILKIHQNPKVEFSLSRKYDFSKEVAEAKEEISEATRELEAQKRVVEGELSTIKQEIAILNNELIKKYYNFSDYSKITSQDCKNELVLLKQKEHELREQGKDVVIQNKYERTNKTADRIIRQMLRTFNAECDNIMMNISTKNIDRVRKQIQNSYETINKLYLIDSASLRKELLEIKLEQATLMYTYELKYQQEKDIQRAIKEQMVEEAKAQREIEEQKKKIEKDLQQHLGEVNRLMKYLQKTQIDAEKQLYMDKIKELEEKIKSLEGDKATVLEREANAKAGFVYIISNIGSFGENIYKIGMTRRLEPMDRIHELSSASVPFEFDVHAMIFSSDAPELETMLHRHFADKAVNKVNPRKEFYNVDIDEIEKVVKENYNDTVQFTKIPVATEYRQSMNMQETAP